jgi:rhodanese-related sulfurtransferase
MLIDRGFVRVRPLLGGLDAWVAAGYTITVIQGEA